VKILSKLLLKDIIICIIYNIYYIENIFFFYNIFEGILQTVFEFLKYILFIIFLDIYSIGCQTVVSTLISGCGLMQGTKL
jgi:hypothetical protein